MAELSISYAEAAKRYPTQLAAVMAKIRKGKSRCKNDAPGTFEWKIVWCERIGSPVTMKQGLQDLLTRTVQPVPQPKTEDEEWASRSGNIFAHLSAKKGRFEWYGVKGAEFPTPPEEIERSVRGWFRKQEADQARFDALSPVAQQKEIQSLLGGLSRSPGFFAVRIGGKP